MLGKLLKYEFKATGRVYLPLFAVLLLFTVVNKVFMIFRPHGSSLPQGIVMTGYVMIIVAIAVITLIMAIQRFHKNLLGDEGYLMFTLPVKSWQLICSKLIPAMTWSIVSGMVSMLSIGVLVADKNFFSDLAWVIRVAFMEWSEQMPISMFSFAMYMLALILLSTMAGYIMMYLSIAVGHQVPKSRMLASFGAFLAISILLQIATTIVINIYDTINIFNLLDTMSMQGATHAVMWAMILPIAAFCALAFWGTKYLLSKRLNLE